MNAAIERAPRAELEALQRERLRATVAARPAHAARRARPPAGDPELTDAAVHDQGRPARALPARPAGRPARHAAPDPRLQRLARAPDRRRLHAGRPRRLDRGDGALHGDGRRQARHGRPQRLRLRPVHRRPRLPPGRRADRGAHDPGLRRRHRAPGAAPEGPPGPGPVLHAVLRAPHRPGPARSRDRQGRAGAGDRPVRRRAVDRGDARPDRGRARAHSRSTSTGSRRSSARASPPSAPRPATACTSRRTTSSSRSSTPRPARRARTARTASWSSRR